VLGKNFMFVPRLTLKNENLDKPKIDVKLPVVTGTDAADLRSKD